MSTPEGYGAIVMLGLVPLPVVVMVVYEVVYDGADEDLGLDALVTEWCE